MLPEDNNSIISSTTQLLQDAISLFSKLVTNTNIESPKDQIIAPVNYDQEYVEDPEWTDPKLEELYKLLTAWITVKSKEEQRASLSTAMIHMLETNPNAAPGDLYYLLAQIANHLRPDRLTYTKRIFDYLSGKTSKVELANNQQFIKDYQRRNCSVSANYINGVPTIDEQDLANALNNFSHELIQAIFELNQSLGNSILDFIATHGRRDGKTIAILPRPNDKNYPYTDNFIIDQSQITLLFRSAISIFDINDDGEVEMHDLSAEPSPDAILETRVKIDPNSKQACQQVNIRYLNHCKPIVFSNQEANNFFQRSELDTEELTEDYTLKLRA